VSKPVKLQKKSPSTSEKNWGHHPGTAVGFGLSYTSYSYSEPSTAAAGSTVEVTVQASHSEVMGDVMEMGSLP